MSPEDEKKLFDAVGEINTKLNFGILFIIIIFGVTMGILVTILVAK